MRRGVWCGTGTWGPWAAIGLGRSPRFFDFGEVRLAILSLLEDGPKHGYQVMKELEERSGGMYRASAGSVYPTLQQLEDEGLITSRQQNGKRVYRLTNAGREELKHDPEGVRRIWERAERWEDWGQSINPEALSLLGPAVMVLKATMRAARRTGGRPEREQRIRTILDRAVHEIQDLEKSWE